MLGTDPQDTSLSSSLGVLVRCDASIKAMLLDIDVKNRNEFIIEELDDEHLLVKESKVAELKQRLQSVSNGTRHTRPPQLTSARR